MLEVPLDETADLFLNTGAGRIRCVLHPNIGKSIDIYVPYLVVPASPSANTRIG